MLTILVEGRTDSEIVKNILMAAEVPMDSIKIKAIQGKKKMKDVMLPIKLTGENFLVLIDSDKLFVKDSIKEAQIQLDTKDENVFCAVPEIESWLFADDNLFKREVIHRVDKINRDEALDILDRIIQTDELIYPKKVLNIMGLMGRGIKFDFSFLREMNIERACIRSTSLRNFLQGVFKALKIDDTVFTTMLSRNINRDIFSSLVKEVLPADEVIFKSLDGENISAKQMISEIETGTELGKDYCSQIFRIARDLLIRSIKLEDKK